MPEIATKTKQKRANMIMVGGMISLIALIVGIISVIAGQLYCGNNEIWLCGYYFFAGLIVAPFFILGLGVSFVSFIVHLIIRLANRQNKALQSNVKVKKPGRGDILPSIKIALAIIFCIVGIYTITIVISSPVSDVWPPVLCSLVLLVLSVVLFVTGYRKR